MALHKMVNGQKIELSAEEERNIIAEWAANEEKEVAAKEAHRQKMEKKQQIKQSMMEKLELSEEDFDLLFNFRG